MGSLMPSCIIFAIDGGNAAFKTDSPRRFNGIYFCAGHDCSGG
jgi:hypothetical protein